LVLNQKMQQPVARHGLGFVATVCPDGTPNLSPKGTMAIWDDEHLVFLDLRSPGTVGNLAANPAMEINVVDPIVRKGYRFKGTAQVVGDGPLFERIIDFYRRERGTARERVRAAVLMRVDHAVPLISPIYDLETSEEEVAARWRQRYLKQAPDQEITARATSPR
jgi:predicted pyridoxine 5'-phosphate oxidase superfamily flavin-nucleotide-binding protein